MSGNRERPSIFQLIGLSLIDQMLTTRKPVKELEVFIYDSLGDRGRAITGGADLFQVTALAIDVLGDGDPEFLPDLYKFGGKIEETVVVDLATAVILAQRHGSDSLHEFQKLSSKHDMKG